jgi:hypothetical protein
MTLAIDTFTLFFRVELTVYLFVHFWFQLWKPYIPGHLPTRFFSAPPALVLAVLVEVCWINLACSPECVVRMKPVAMVVGLNTTALPGSLCDLGCDSRRCQVRICCHYLQSLLACLQSLHIRVPPALHGAMVSSSVGFIFSLFATCVPATSKLEFVLHDFLREIFESIRNSDFSLEF